MLRKIASLVIMGLLVSGFAAWAGDAKKEAAAVAAAETWLAMVDNEKYAESWKAAAEPFRNAVQPGQWEQSLRVVRKSLGNVITRKMKTKTYATTLPGAPDGEYVVIQFEASFAGKAAALETVTPMMERDGVWRVSGYYIR